MTILIALYFAVNIFYTGRFYEETKDDTEDVAIRWSFIIVSILFFCIIESFLYIKQKLWN